MSQTKHNNCRDNGKLDKTKSLSKQTKHNPLAIENGIAKEQAPVQCCRRSDKSRLYMNGTLRSWVHYIELRSANGTQIGAHAHCTRMCKSNSKGISAIQTPRSSIWEQSIPGCFETAECPLIRMNLTCGKVSN